MKIVRDVSRRPHVNVMELLVAEEVQKQTQALSPRVLKYLKTEEVETYALNRLPSLYASSEKGWQHQYEKAKRELHNQIKGAVRQAIAAVQIDPIRSSEPLKIGDDESAQVALEALRTMLDQPELTWDGIVDHLQVVLGKPGRQDAPGGESHRSRHRPPTTPPPRPPKQEGEHGHHWRPGTYGAEISWQKSHDSSSDHQYDWNDSRYAK
jgi:hypothetical protein